MLELDLVIRQLDATAQTVASKEVTVTTHDTKDSLLSLIKDEFTLDIAARIQLSCERMKNDPDDPTTYKKLTPEAVIGCIRSYLQSHNITALFSPLYDGKLELFFTVLAQQSPPAAAAAISGCKTPVTQLSASGNVSQPGTSVRKGKQRQKPWHDLCKQLIRENILRANIGKYYPAKDIIPDTAFNKAKTMSHEFVIRAVLAKHKVDGGEKAVKEYISTRISRVNKQIENKRKRSNRSTAAAGSACKQGDTAVANQGEPTADEGGQQQQEEDEQQEEQLEQEEDQQQDEQQDEDQQQDEQQIEEQQEDGQQEEEQQQDGQQQNEQQQEADANEGSRLEMPSAEEWAKVREWVECKGRSREIYTLARQGQPHADWVEYLQDDYMTQEAQDAAIKKAYAQAAAAVTGAPPAIKAAASTGLSIVEATSQGPSPAASAFLEMLTKGTQPLPVTAAARTGKLAIQAAVVAAASKAKQQRARRTQEDMAADTLQQLAASNIDVAAARTRGIKKSQGRKAAVREDSEPEIGSEDDTDEGEEADHVDMQLHDDDTDTDECQSPAKPAVKKRRARPGPTSSAPKQQAGKRRRTPDVVEERQGKIQQNSSKGRSSKAAVEGRAAGRRTQRVVEDFQLPGQPAAVRMSGRRSAAPPRMDL